MQMSHAGSIKACVHNFYAQMKVVHKVTEFAKKCIIVGGVSKVGD